MPNKIKAKKKISKPKMRIKKRAILFFVLLIVAVIGCAYGVRWLTITLKYKEYTDKMYTYGLAELYDNEKATATDKVTNEEMLRIVIAAVTGKKDINQLYHNNDISDEYKWLDYTTSLGYTKNITQDNLKDKASKIETVLTATRASDLILKLNLQQSQLDMSKSALSKFDTEEKEIIAKAVTMGIIENKTSSLSEKHILKGELNKLVVTIIEKYSTIYYKAMEYNEQGVLEKQDVSLVTDIDKMPKNYKDYPYIVDSIDSPIYEYDFKIITERTAQTPKEAYKYMGDLYVQIDELLVDYFNEILNIDYTTITSTNFLESIQSKTVYRLEEQDVQEYVDYVKANKIKLSGKAVALLPIIYNNGEQYMVRTKITFNVINSNTQYNLLFGDQNQKIKYNGKDITMYVDVPMGMTVNAWSLRVYTGSLAKHLVGNNTSVVVE